MRTAGKRLNKKKVEAQKSYEGPRTKSDLRIVKSKKLEEALETMENVSI
jgi:hypothetical protein